MRKPRDFDQELRTLNEKARTLKERKVRQLGELVIATGADAMEVQTLAGGLLSLTDASPASKEGWRKRGEGFFRARPTKPSRTPAAEPASPGEAAGDPPPGGAGPGAP